MKTIYTIGYTRKSLERFIRLLQEARVDAVIDIRRRNTSPLAGFARRDDLAFLLRQGFGMAYEHILALAPTDEMLDAYKKDGDWEVYQQEYGQLLQERDAVALGRAMLEKYERPCFLCAEDEPNHCHRRLLVEYLAKALPDIEIVHLSGEESHASGPKR